MAKKNVRIPRRRRKRSVAVLVATLVLAACTWEWSGSSSAPGAATSSGIDTSLASDAAAAQLLALLDEVQVVAKRPQARGYDRDCGPGDGCVFGTAWTDAHDGPLGRNGCDTRNDVLRTTLTDVVLRPGSNGCAVEDGTLHDPYTGTTMNFATERRQIHVDHVIPLAAAWDLGAWRWTQARRVAFANDVEHELIAVQGSANLAKRDSTPASWLPPAKQNRCAYLTKYLEASLHWELPITEADRTVIGHAARKC